MVVVLSITSSVELSLKKVKKPVLKKITTNNNNIDN
jgi:hypothetical protein